SAPPMAPKNISDPVAIVAARGSWAANGTTNATIEMAGNNELAIRPMGTLICSSRKSRVCATTRLDMRGLLRGQGGEGLLKGGRPDLQAGERHVAPYELDHQPVGVGGHQADPAVHALRAQHAGQLGQPVGDEGDAPHAHDVAYGP